ncbi:MAG: hypothetical protein K6V73_06450 [Firmicutes bacterium]|nr:hypothetical protein [Bacillota bacterium]
MVVVDAEECPFIRVLPARPLPEAARVPGEVRPSAGGGGDPGAIAAIQADE